MLLELSDVNVAYDWRLKLLQCLLLLLNAVDLFRRHNSSKIVIHDSIVLLQPMGPSLETWRCRGLF